MSETQASRRDTFVTVENNPAPEGAELVWFEGMAGRSLRACLAPSTRDRARGTAIVCPGRTEFIEKYFETARDLQARGFAVVILDWPGQGLSDRLLEDPKKGHIDRFETFMSALSKGLDAMPGDLPRPYVSLAHSMGGAIALAAIVKKLVRVDAAAFTAPMWGLPVNLAVRYLIWAMRAVGRDGDYARQPGPPETFESNIVTHDRKRWQLQRDLIAAAPELEVGPMTWGWLGASLDILNETRKPALLRGIECPVFVASAGEEALVDNKAHGRVVRHLPDCTHITIEGARHEILMEEDAMRDQFWAGFDAFLTRSGL
ncbi:MAG: alpha/beta hydrolase [Henriciella sp.]|uniref:alpha/beta fold hydrolase n=1 Tax=uncultured Henriciella sp. TaxID=1608424 RepID=UPI000C54EBE9|nr:alpha/beta hydrolase [Henriciella sp.]MBF33599.1 alpha/beta hydrolase [Hyphomonadaceae bacterium]MBK74560.1 alpha/beta hydrolase [Henriciella sp.]|tara:strand:+ start:746 stop:1693 length:948 start_codon:yes stop_codon:yes gene_type:complete